MKEPSNQPPQPEGPRLSRPLPAHRPRQSGSAAERKGVRRRGRVFDYKDRVVVLSTLYVVLGVVLIVLGVWVGWTAGEQVLEAMNQSARAILLVLGPILLGVACLVMAFRTFTGTEAPSSRAAERKLEAGDDRTH